jgi:molecular chaperone GrpE
MSKKRTSDKPADGQSQQDEVDDLRQQVTMLTEALQRERADATNLRRRYEDQVAGARDTAKAGVITAFLPVIDNLERALKHVPADLETNDYVKGVRGVVRQFDGTLEGLGVWRIETIGKDFNPDLHEAVSMEDGEGAREVITEELQPGYCLDNGTVIRHAIVRVKSQ